MVSGNELTPPGQGTTATRVAQSPLLDYADSDADGPSRSLVAGCSRVRVLRRTTRRFALYCPPTMIYADTI